MNGLACSISDFPRSDLRALRHRLEGLNRDPRYRFMFGRLVVEDDIAKVVSRLFRIPNPRPAGYNRPAGRACQTRS